MTTRSILHRVQNPTNSSFLDSRHFHFYVFYRHQHHLRIVEGIEHTWIGLALQQWTEQCVSDRPCP